MVKLIAYSADEPSAEIVALVAAARAMQTERFEALEKFDMRVNARSDGELLDEIAELDADGLQLLIDAPERLQLSTRSWHRILRVARTISDLDGADSVHRVHVAEALSYRRVAPGR